MIDKRKYHEYKDTWVSVDGEELSCRRKPTNWEDQFAVAVTKDSTIVGHVPSQFVHCSCGSLEASVAVLQE